MSRLNEIANRIINTDFYGMMDADATPESVIESIMTEPIEVINYLLNIIEQED